MSKRYALFMSSYKPISGINYQIDASICNKLLHDLKSAFHNAFGNGEFAFKWTDDTIPEPKITELAPTTGKIVDTIQELDRVITEDDILLFYYFGHGYYNKKLCLAYEQYSLDSNPDNFSIDHIVSQAYVVGVRNMIIVLDCCYSGLAEINLNHGQMNYILLSASYDKYSFHDTNGGHFTRKLIESLNDHNRDSYLNHVSLSISSLYNKTKDKLEQFAHENPEASIRLPHYAHHGLEDFELVPIDRSIFRKPAFDSYARFNTIYRKLFILSEYLIDNLATLEEIYTWITEEIRHSSFKISEHDYVDIGTVQYYLEILIKLRFVAQSPNGKFEITDQGVFATRDSGKEFNKYLIKNVLSFITSRDLNWEDVAVLRNDVFETFKNDLIGNYIVPNYLNFERAFFVKHNLSMIDRRDLRILLQLYSFTEDLQRMDSNTYFIM